MKTLPQSNLILLSKQLYWERWTTVRLTFFNFIFCIVDLHRLNPHPGCRMSNCPQNDAFVARVYELTASAATMAGEVKVWVSNKPIHQPWEFYTGGGGVNDWKCWCLKINFMTRHNNIIQKHFNDWYLEYKDGLTDGKISRKKGLTNWPKTAFQPCLVLNHATQGDDAKPELYIWTYLFDAKKLKRWKVNIM